jgi:hypothetical protein
MTDQLLALLVLLPFATCLLGSVLGLLDHTDRVATLRRIAWRGLPFVAAGLVLGTRAGAPAAGAIVAALCIHVAVFLGTRLAVRRGWMTQSTTAWWDN